MPNAHRSPLHKSILSSTDVSQGSNSVTPTEEKNQGQGQKSAKTRKRIRSEDSSDDFTVFKNEMKDMLSSMFSSFTSTFTSKQNERMRAIERQLFEVKTHTLTISDIEKSLNNLSGQLTDMQNKIDKLEGDRKEIKNQIHEIEDRIDSSERAARKTCIEIRSVPKTQGERKDDLFNMVKKLLSHLNVEHSPGDLRDVYRIPNKLNNNISTLIVEFSSTLLKGAVLNSAKKHNTRDSAKLNTRHLGLDVSPTLLYISEHLTPKSRRLHYLARDFARTQNFAFCWTSQGAIYLRKCEGTPHILIKTEAQLEAMKKTA